MKPYVAAVFEGGDWFDDVVLANGGPWSARRTCRGRVAARSATSNIAVLFPNSFRSALVARLGGCRRRIGYARYGRSLLLTDALEAERDATGPAEAESRP